VLVTTALLLCGWVVATVAASAFLAAALDVWWHAQWPTAPSFTMVADTAQCSLVDVGILYREATLPQLPRLVCLT
jgi:hypothetical protein